MPGSKKCEPDCTCGRHNPKPRSEESRSRASEQMKKEWANPDSSHRSEESRLKTSESVSCVWADPDSVYNTEEYRSKQFGGPRKGLHNGVPTTGCINSGYVLKLVYDHPLARQNAVAEHRLVLWDKLGCESLDCEHECHWGCGKTLTWSEGRLGIQADHLNGDTLDNRPENLVESCLRCNVERGAAGNPMDWRQSSARV